MIHLPQIFISYSKQDVEFVRYLAALLRDQGFDVWYDAELNPGEDWWTVLEREIRACDAFIVVMTPQARQSRWVLRELLLAEKLHKPVFPVLVTGDVWPNLADLQYAEMRGGLRSPLPARLLDQLHTLKADRASVQLILENANIMTYPADVAAFKYAQSFHGADGHAAARLRDAGIDESQYTPGEGEFSLIDSRSALAASQVLFVGTPILRGIGYEGLHTLAVNALSALQKQAPDTEHLVMTFHGGNFGLDETEAALSQLRGLVAAVGAGQYPPNLKRITVVERTENRFNRLRRRLVDPLAELGVHVGKDDSQGEHWIIPGPTHHGGPASDQMLEPEQRTHTHAFVIMPQDAALDDLFYYAIQTPVHAHGLLCERMESENYGSDLVGADLANQIRTRIDSASVVIALLPDADPMLYWQVGYACGVQCPVIVISNQKEQSPMIEGLPRLNYQKLRDVETGLAAHLEDLRQTGKLQL